MEQALRKIREILNANGFIMLNENQKYPSISGCGGGWSEAINLIESRKAFLTKLIEGKSTFISPKLYYSIRACQGTIVLSENERTVYECIRYNEPIDIQFIRLFVPIEEKEIKRILVTLQNRLMITAIGEAKRISESWGVYLWGTGETWEKDVKDKYQLENPREIVNQLLLGKISEKKLRIIINDQA